MYGQSPKKFADFVFSSENLNLIVPGGLMKYDSKPGKWLNYCLLLNVQWQIFHAYSKQEKIYDTCTIKLVRNQGWMGQPWQHGVLGREEKKICYKRFFFSSLYAYTFFEIYKKYL